MADVAKDELENTLLELCKYIRQITKGGSSEQIKILPELVVAVAELIRAICDVDTNL